MSSLPAGMRRTFFVWGPTHGFSGFYFRIGGYGLAWNRDLPQLFSERYGHRKVWRFGRWALQFLA